MTKENVPVLEDRPGWTGLIETLEKRIGYDASGKSGRPRIAASTVSNPTRIGCRCELCRTPDTVLVPRVWPAPADREPEPSVSPGQWTQDLRGGATGANWDMRDWRNYGRIEDKYRTPVELLMSATDDETAVRLWAGGPGWAGLIRALFLTLRSEQDERPDDPNHVPWRLRYMKEKWGYLDVRTTAATPYQDGAARVIGDLSTRTCVRCGNPAEIRQERWVRPECDDCWARASPEARR